MTRSYYTYTKQWLCILIVTKLGWSWKYSPDCSGYAARSVCLCVLGVFGSIWTESGEPVFRLLHRFASKKTNCL